MILLDILIWAFLLGFVVKGFMKGLVREVCSLLGLVTGGWAAFKYYSYLAEAIRPFIHLPQHVALVLSFVTMLSVLSVPIMLSADSPTVLTVDIAYRINSLRDYNVAVVSLYPGLVRTEAVMQSAEWLDLTNSESPQFTGRAGASLAADPDVMNKSGKVLIAAQLGEEYGFSDIDGKKPRPLTLKDV